MDVGLNKELDL